MVIWSSRSYDDADSVALFNGLIEPHSKLPELISCKLPLLLIKYKNPYQFYQTCKAHDTCKTTNIFSASVIGSFYYIRGPLLAKRYLQFYRCHGPYMFDKTGKIFIFNICCFYTTSVVLMLVSIS